jgi:hypothetical protein
MRLPDPRERPWLTVDEVADITGEGTKVIRAAMAAGQLPLLEIGRYHRVPTEQLYRVLQMDPAGEASTPMLACAPTDDAHNETDRADESNGTAARIPRQGTGAGATALRLASLDVQRRRGEPPRTPA